MTLPHRIGGYMLASPCTSQVGELLDLGRAGDPLARARLINYAADRLRTLAHGMLRANPLRRWEQSDDLLQQTLIRLSRRLDRIAALDARSFLNLAALEMRNALIDMARHYFGPLGPGKRHSDNPIESSACGSKPLDSKFLDPAAAFEQLEEWEGLYFAIDQLAQDEQEVVNLLWIHELTQIEAATVLGVVPKTISRRWRRARLQLIQLLQHTPFEI